MTVTITYKDNFLGITKQYTNVDYDKVSYKETKRRKFNVISKQVRIENGKRDIVLDYTTSSSSIKIQDEETGRTVFEA